MNDKATKTRDQIEAKYKWDIEAMYPDEKTWEADFEKVSQLAKNFECFFGKLGESASSLLSAFRERDELWRLAENVYVYARMRRDEDNRVTKYQAMSDRCHSLFANASASMSFFTPELLEIPENTLKAFIAEEKGLQQYEFAIFDTLRQKAHVLTTSEENLLAQVSEVLGATNDIFTMLNNADMKFGNIFDEDGDEVELTHGKYINFMESQNRDVRKSAFERMYDTYKKQINTIATTYNYNTKTDIVFSKIRKHESYLHAALSGDNVPVSVYNNLIDTVNKNLNTLHRYMDIRKKALKLDELHMYDVYVPLVELPKEDVPYETAIEMMQVGLSPLGTEYQCKMKQGLNERWVDVYENEGKTSGAYSFGSYDSKPYILLNYTSTLKDVFTLAHEMGHSLHSQYSRETQPYIYGGHSIFTAEVASTVNEILLINHLSKNATDANMKKYLLNMYIEEFRGTLFRQTMFAEFEKLTHQAVADGEALTAEWLCDEYSKLNKKYFGENVVTCDNIQYEWARIPHFYRAFYVYKYATGFSAAAAITTKILSGNENAQENYIEFLKSGESNHPIELLKIAGVDMGTSEPIELAMKTFKNLVEEFEKIV